MSATSCVFLGQLLALFLFCLLLCLHQLLIALVVVPCLILVIGFPHTAFVVLLPVRVCFSAPYNRLLRADCFHPYSLVPPVHN